jgi:thymidylate synthase
MVAQQTGFKPHEFIHWTADSHIYEDQIPAVKEYLDRDKPDSPKLKLKKADDIDSYNLDHFKLEGYKPQPILKIPVAV